MGQGFQPPPGFDEFTIEERIEYLAFLWERIRDTEASVPVPAWHLEILEERLREHEQAPDEAEPWEAVRAQLRAEAASER